MIGSIVIFISGVVILNICTRFLISGSKSIAYRLNVPKIFGLLLIVAISVSIPEFAVSMNAMARGNVDLVLGVIFGSCFINSLLILGVSSFNKPLCVKNNTINKELPLYLLCTGVLFVLFHDIEISKASFNQITRNDGVVIVLFFFIFLYYLISYTSKNSDIKNKKPKYSLGISIVLIIIGLAGIVLGSEYIVSNSIILTELLGMSEKLFAMTFVSFAVSIPEVVSCVKLFNKGEQDYLIGNMITSNIFNICIALGIPILIYGSIATTSFSIYDFISLMCSGLVLFVVAKTNNTITKKQGLMMILIFIIYYLWLFLK